MRPAILLHGPTASGKTGLAIALAKRLHGEIVNADSMQVYSGLRILTARPSDHETEQAAHHLFGHVEPDTRFSAGRWLAEAAPLVGDIRARGKTPIVVGGTGLYLHVLKAGLADIPPIPEEARAEAKLYLEANGPEALHARLAEVDPEAAERLSPGDRQRVMRAYEVFLATGQPLSGFHGETDRPLKPGEWLGVCLHPSREALYQRIDLRFEAMVQAGALDEARALAARGLAGDLPAMKAHGAPWLMAHARGEITLADAMRLAKRDTRRYAKRQYTWIAQRFQGWARIPADSMQSRMRVILSLYAEIDDGGKRG